MTSCRTEVDGDCLGECTTNVFVLADARGLRWKKFVTTYNNATTISEDPILSAYSKALSLDLMCIWQRCPNYNLPLKEEPGSNKFLDCPKELILFWYGEEPVLSGVINTTLKEVSTGCFDGGFPTEYQGYFYKALHNLIERHLLNYGFVRIGKWFSKPVENNLSKRESPAFSFSFFIYGESVVAASVEVDKRPSVRRLNKDDVTSANSCTGLPSVILAPYGLKAVLTGNSLPQCDAQASKLISDWNRFFSFSPSPDDASGNVKDSVPPIVEVAVKDTRMLFPSKLVVLSQAGKNEGSTLFGSADENGKLDAIYSDGTNNNYVSASDLSESLSDKIWRQLGAKKENIKPTTGTVKTEGQSSSTSTTALWDFRESLRHTACGCTSSSNVTRTKPIKKFGAGSGIPRSSYSPIEASPKGSSPVTVQGGVNTNRQKIKREAKKPMSFHHRSCHLTDRSHTPPLLPALSGARTLHTQPVIQGFNSVTIGPKENLVTNPSSYTMINRKTKEEEIDNIATESLRSTGTNLLSIQNKLPHVTTSVNSTKYLRKKADRRIKKFGFYQLPTVITGQPPKLEEDYLQGFRPSEDFSVYTAHEHLPLSDGQSINLNTALSPRESGVYFSSSLSDAEKSKRMKRSVSSDSNSVENKKMKRLESSSPVDLTLSTPQNSDPELSSRAPTVQAGEKKRGQGRPRGRRGSNIQSPKPELTSPVSDVFSPLFDEEAALLSPGSGSKRRNSSTVKSKEPSQPLASPSNAVSAPAKSSQQRSKKRPQAGRAKKDSAKQDNSFDPKESYSILLNPPPNIVLPNAMKNATLPSPQSTHFSPPTPRHSASRLLNIKDLQVSENDLNMIFESDEEDDIPKLSKGLAHPDVVGHVEESCKSAFSQNLVTSTGLTQQDLAQMFPTPPSQEPQIHAASPATPSHVEYLNTGSMPPVAILSPEKTHIHVEREPVEIKVEPGIFEETLTPTFELPVYATHPTASLFAPLKDLPSTLLRPITSEIPVYKPSTNVKNQIPELRTTVIPPLRIKSPPELAPSSLNVSPSILCQNTLSSVPGAVLPGAPIIRPQLPTPTEIPPLTPSPLIKTRRPEFPVPPALGPYDMDSQSLRMTLILSDSVVNCFGQSGVQSSEVNLWLSEVDPKLWYPVKLKEPTPVLWPFFSDDAPLPDSWGRLNLGQFPMSQQKRPSSLPLLDTKFMKSENDKGKIEINNAFLKVISDQWSSPFSAQYLENIIESMYNPYKASTSRTVFSDTFLIEILQDLRPHLQEALQKPLRRCSWESARVEGPSTFQSFHKFASKVGLQGNFAVQPILAGHDGDWMSISPYSLRYWEKLLLEPFGGRRDIAYIAVAPDSETVLENTRWFFKELSSLYESLNLGQHSPITNVLREGIMRVNESMIQKLAQESVDDWFTQDEGSDAVKMKLLAQACKGYLGPHLTSLMGKLTSEKPSLATDYSKGKGPMSPAGVGAHPSAAEEAVMEEERASLPAIVIYMVDPFQKGSTTPKSPLWSVTGLFRSFAEMVQNLPAQLKENVFLQVVPVEFILRIKFGTASGSNLSLRPHDLRQLAISVYSQCRSPPKLLSTAKALTGFGNAVVRENLVFKRQNDNQLPSRVYLPPCVLATPPNLISEDIHSLNGFDKALKAQDVNVLYCGYCLSQDRNWIFTVCTDRSGEISESCIIRVNSNKRNPKGAATSRQSALRRLWDFVYGIISFTTNPWRVVFNRFGKPGKGELQDFINLVRKVMEKKFVDKSSQPESCRACNSMHVKDDCPVIRSVSYTTVDLDTGIRLLHRTRRSRHGIARSRVYVVPSLQSSPTQQSSQPPARQTPVTWVDRNEDEFLSDPASLLLGGPEEDGSDTDFLPLLTSPSDPNNLVYSSDLISPSSEIAGHFMTNSTMSSGGVNDNGQIHRLTATRMKTSTSPFQPITQQTGAFGLGSPAGRKSSPSVLPSTQSSDENELLLEQPLAVGYILSGFSASQSRKNTGNRSFVARSELRFHFVNEDAQPCLHHLDSNNNLEILRYLLEQLDALSWLTVDPATGERRSQLAVHLYLLLGVAEYFQHLFS